MKRNDKIIQYGFYDRTTMIRSQLKTSLSNHIGIDNGNLLELYKKS